MTLGIKTSDAIRFLRTTSNDIRENPNRPPTAKKVAPVSGWQTWFRRKYLPSGKPGKSRKQAARGLGACLILSLAVTMSCGPSAFAQDNAAPKLTNQICLACHGQQALIPQTPEQPSPAPKILTERFEGSVHGKLNCTDCHTNITSLPHGKVTVQVGCVLCHQSLLETAQEAKTPPPSPG
jgi:hypothetical protein